ncbi:unnamed protein product [Fraxinus pennsylvanica]|uniref:Uncharacterized protein n=1 Tax=Fraxinus pennsylvanica TaxID=56036 RepID=A0AAD1ZCM9_9LAMI|nr:unnamed protein product [Fraxinus pennsylvanica]
MQEKELKESEDASGTWVLWIGSVVNGLSASNSIQFHAQNEVPVSSVSVRTHTTRQPPIVCMGCESDFDLISGLDVGGEVDPNVENEDTLGSDNMDGFLSDLANAIPGIDEAMSFAEMLNCCSTVAAKKSMSSEKEKHFTA